MARIIEDLKSRISKDGYYVSFDTTIISKTSEGKRPYNEVILRLQEIAEENLSTRTSVRSFKSSPIHKQRKSMGGSPASGITHPARRTTASRTSLTGLNGQFAEALNERVRKSLPAAPRTKLPLMQLDNKLNSACADMFNFDLDDKGQLKHDAHKRMKTYFSNKGDFGEILRETTTSNGYEFVFELLVDDGDQSRKSREIILNKDYVLLGVRELASIHCQTVR